MAPMELRSLGTSGLKVSVLSLGAMTFGESKTFMNGVTSSDEALHLQVSFLHLQQRQQ